MNDREGRDAASRSSFSPGLFPRSLAKIAVSPAFHAESSFSVKAKLNYFVSWKEGSVKEVMLVLLFNTYVKMVMSFYATK